MLYGRVVPAEAKKRACISVMLAARQSRESPIVKISRLGTVIADKLASTSHLLDSMVERRLLMQHTQG